MREDKIIITVFLVLVATLFISIASHSGNVTGAATATSIFSSEIDIFVAEMPVYILLLIMAVIIAVILLAWKYFNPSLEHGWEQGLQQPSNISPQNNLQNYISTAKAQGKTPDEIKQKLISVGWDEETINTSVK